MDSDDWIDEKMYAIMIETAIQNNADIVYCNISEEWRGQWSTFSVPYNEDKATFLWNYLKNEHLTPLVSMLTQRTIFTNKKLKTKDEFGYGEDMLLSTMLYYYANRIAKVDKALYFYRENQDSISRNGTPKYKLDAELANIINLHDFFLDKEMYSSIKSVLLGRILSAKRYILTIEKDIDKWTRVVPESNAYIWNNPVLGLKGKIIEWSIYMLHKMQQWLLKIDF